MKLFGNKLFIFFSFTLLIACNTQYLKAIRSRNKIGNDIYTFYKNDSLKISIQFFGDYEPINLKDTSYNKHLYKPYSLPDKILYKKHYATTGLIANLANTQMLKISVAQPAQNRQWMEQINSL